MVSKELRTISCRGAVCWGPGEPMIIEEIEVEPPGASEIRIKMLYASICHTDVRRWHGRPCPMFPRILGHEGVGLVESIGEEVEGLKEGDLVIPTFVGECGECKNCKSCKTNCCLKYHVATDYHMSEERTGMSVKGQRLYRLFTCSTFCEFTVVNANYVVKVDPRINLRHASILSCGFSTGFGCVWKEAKIEKDSTVAVFGLGGVGIGAVAAAQLLGASRIVGVDINECKENKAITFGMTDFINPKSLNDKSVVEAIREVTGGLGVDYSFECTGSEGLIGEVLESTTVGIGVTVMVGVPNHLTTSQTAIMGKTLKGSYFGGIKPRSDLPTIFTKCINQEFNLDEMLTHEVDLEMINYAFQLLKEPDCLKVLVKIDKTGDPDFLNSVTN